MAENSLGIDYPARLAQFLDKVTKRLQTYESGRLDHNTTLTILGLFYETFPEIASPHPEEVRRAKEGQLAKKAQKTDSEEPGRFGVDPYSLSPQ